MADEEVKKEEATEKKQGGKNTLMIVLIALIVLLIGAVGAIGYFVYTKDANAQVTSANDTAKDEKTEEKSSENQTFIAKIEDLVLNITNAKGREKLMKLSFAIKSSEVTIEAIVEANNAEIIDAVIAQISSRSSEELLTVGGKALLKEEMLKEINAIVNEATASNEDIKRNNVKRLFFTSFVIK